jgi:nicotinamide mononucleotide transporter
MEQAIEILGTIIGIIYLWLEYRASIYLWIAGIIMPSIYIYIYYNAGLYADFGINIYYLIIALYGWLAWKYNFSIFGRKKEKESPTLPITHTPSKKWLPLTMLSAAVWLLIAFLLNNFTDSNVVWWDSFTTALSIVGMYMLARKYAEQWLVWIVVDIISSGLYIYKELYFTAALYAVYAIIAIFGYRKWIRIMQEKQ